MSYYRAAVIAIGVEATPAVNLHLMQVGSLNELGLTGANSWSVMSMWGSPKFSLRVFRGCLGSDPGFT